VLLRCGCWLRRGGWAGPELRVARRVVDRVAAERLAAALIAAAGRVWLLLADFLALEVILMEDPKRL
jgi:hypothetical protein